MCNVTSNHFRRPFPKVWSLLIITERPHLNQWYLICGHYSYHLSLAVESAAKRCRSEKHFACCCQMNLETKFISDFLEMIKWWSTDADSRTVSAMRNDRVAI